LDGGEQLRGVVRTGAAAGDASPVPSQSPASSSLPPARGIAAAAGLITLGNAASRLLGLVREQVIAGLFGREVAASMFKTAATVPTMVYDLVIGGAVSAALIPVFAEYTSRADEEGRAELGRVVGTIAALALLVLSAVTAVLILLAPSVAWALGVVHAPGAQDQTILLVRIALPSVIFLGLSSIVTALLYARQEFAFPAFAVAFYNAGIILGALLLAPVLGVTSLVLGVLLGAICQLALQLVGLRRARIRLAVDLRHPAVRRILKLYAPVALGLVVSQVGVIVDRNLAWRTGEDSVAVMSYATTLIQLPLGLVATATSFAVLPRLSRHAAEADGLDAYKQTLALGLRMALLAIVPATVVLVLLQAPLVQLLFERGAFDAQATRITATAVLFYAPQLPFVAVDQLLIFAFYARKNTLTPALVGLAGVGIYLVGGLLLIGPGGLGLRGLVLANTLQNSLHAVLLFGLLWRAAGSLAGYAVGRAATKAVVAAVPMGLAGWAAGGQVPLDRGVLALLVALGLTLVLCGLVYVAALALLRAEEVGDALQFVRRRFVRRKVGV